jgi:resolvase-like protein
MEARICEGRDNVPRPVKNTAVLITAPTVWPLDRKKPASKHSDGILNSSGRGWSMIIGYARVSTSEQNLDLQRDALKRPGCEKIIEDTVSGGKPSRETPDVPRPKCDH